MDAIIETILKYYVVYVAILGCICLTTIVILIIGAIFSDEKDKKFQPSGKVLQVDMELDASQDRKNMQHLKRSATWLLFTEPIKAYEHRTFVKGQRANTKRTSSI